MKKAVVIGAGPAGLAAADTLAAAGVDTVVLEKDVCAGGLSRTVTYKGYRFDIGGHRFYTKNDAVMSWWQGLLAHDFRKVKRRSRIYYKNGFFVYPLTISSIFSRIGLAASLSIFFSYIHCRIFKLADESVYEQWLINRFGRKLYEIFFKDYTHKVWGLLPARLSSDVGKRRIKGLSLYEAVRNACSRGRGNSTATLIREFYYPRLGAGMVYDAAVRRIQQKNGEILFGHEVVSIRHDGAKIISVVCKDARTGRISDVAGTDFCSSMPLTQLVSLMDPAAPKPVLDACRRLRYRSIVIVNCIISKPSIFPDNWIYINSPDVIVARIQNFKNWSPDMVPDSGTTPLAMEYFCDEADMFWSLSDSALLDLAARELAALKLCARADVADGCVVRQAKAYPVYEKGYGAQLDIVREYVKKFTELHCIGRYGTFCYDNMDHSVMSGFLAARKVLGCAPGDVPTAAEALDD
ncbi:MAG TPA: FAD-dependent oxidoreductase [Candidatus Omnitrophota bacterium]|nr:FAD-dependent oxidoreductase [Candidatus Omnitrophota bacterium]HQQ06387.1 FAD-dependent oxidoreductase [Candidatus Omnitrophota bacterium]